MRIGVDARPLSRQPAGIYRAVRNTLQHLHEVDSENAYYLYSDREFELPLQNGRWRKRISRTLSFLPGSIWLQTDAKRMAVEDGVDVFWGTAHALPLGLPSPMRRLLTVNDLVWPVYPETMSLYNRLANRLCFRRSIENADVILVPSRSTGCDLGKLFGFSGLRIRVIPYAVEDCFCPIESKLAARHVAQKYGTCEDYICAVGTLEPRKNFITLVEVVRVLRDRHRCKTQLLIAGAKGWKNSPLEKQIARSGLTEKEVKFLGYVPEEDMPYLYSGASVFVFPSLYEGFGFPVLEAMACGAPVVASSASSIPEVTGDAALLVDSHRPGDLAEAISRIRSDPTLREQLTRSGLARASQLKWSDTARAMLDAFAGIDLKRPCASVSAKSCMYESH